MLKLDFLKEILVYSRIRKERIQTLLVLLKPSLVLTEKSFLKLCKLKLMSWNTTRHGKSFKKSGIPKQRMPDGTERDPQILTRTWVFRLNYFPRGLLRKVKARFCGRGHLQQDVDAFDTYAPLASCFPIRMMTVTVFVKCLCTNSHGYDVYVSLPVMFADSSGLDSKSLCLKLKKSLYGLYKAPNYSMNSYLLTMTLGSTLVATCV